MSEAKIIPDFQLVRIYDTEGWDQEWLRANGIKATYNVYLYDKNSVTHCCELTPSFELHLIESSFELADSDKYSDDAFIDRLDFQFREAVKDSDQSDVIYMHCSYVDKIDEKNRHNYGNPFDRKHCVDSLQAFLDGDLEYEDVFEGVVEYCRCNTLL